MAHTLDSLQTQLRQQLAELSQLAQKHPDAYAQTNPKVLENLQSIQATMENTPQKVEVSVHGWDHIGSKTEEGSASNKIAKEILEKNPAFRGFMQKFANPADPKSENFGATQKGEYADVVVHFEELSRLELFEQTPPELRENVGEYLGGCFNQVRPQGGDWINISEKTPDFERNKLGDLNKNLRVLIQIVLAEATSKQAELDATITIPHEIVIHGERSAKRIQAFKKNSKMSFAEFKKQCVSSFKQENSNSAGSGHHQISEGNNKTYEDIHDATHAILAANNAKKYKVQAILKTEAEFKTLKQTDANGQRIGSYQQIVTDEKIFETLRQNERTQYAVSPEHKALINQKFLEKKQQSAYSLGISEKDLNTVFSRILAVKELSKIRLKIKNISTSLPEFQALQFSEREKIVFQILNCPNETTIKKQQKTTSDNPDDNITTEKEVDNTILSDNQIVLILANISMDGIIFNPSLVE